MSPYEHGEVYVLDDGGEVDLDLGNYERFVNIKLSADPNITDEIQDWIERVAQIPVDGTEKTPDVCVIELG